MSDLLPKNTASHPSKKRRFNRLQMGTMVGLVVLAGLILGSWLWALLAAFTMLMGFKELSGLLEANGLKPSFIVFAITALPLLVAAFLGKVGFFLPLLTLGILLTFFIALLRESRMSIGDMGATLFALIYVGYLPVHMVLLREIGFVPGLPFYQQEGFQFLSLTLAVIAFSDIGAYYSGKAFGKNLLYPELSPKKTQEGALGGLLVGLVVGLSLSALFKIPLTHGFILSTLLVVVGAMGDLIESKLKREAGVKDSGVLLESHGGLLDRVDSYLFSGVVAYYYIHWIIKQEGLAGAFVAYVSQGQVLWS